MEVQNSSKNTKQALQTIDKIEVQNVKPIPQNKDDEKII